MEIAKSIIFLFAVLFTAFDIEDRLRNLCGKTSISTGTSLLLIIVTCILWAVLYYLTIKKN